MKELTPQEIFNGLQDIVDAIKLADNGTYFHQIKEELSGLNQTMESIDITLKEMQDTLKAKNPRENPTLRI